MEKSTKVKNGSPIYERLIAIPMPDYERQAAVNAMRDAELIVDGIAWIAKKIERLGGRLFLKPSLKH